MSKWLENMGPTNKKWIGGEVRWEFNFKLFHFPASSFQQIYGYSNIHLALPHIKRHISEVTWLKSGEIKEIQKWLCWTFSFSNSFQILASYF